MIKTIYALRDTKLEEFLQVILLDETIYDNYWFSFCNDIQNNYYRRLNELAIYKVADFDTETGAVTHSFSFVEDCSRFLDKEKQKLVIITQTLNYLPNGYFKMPKEMQEEVNLQVRECIKEYITNYANVEQLNELGVDNV